MLELAIESQSSFVAVIRKDGAHMVDFAPTRGAGLHGESLPRKFTAQLRPGKNENRFGTTTALRLVSFIFKYMYCIL